MTVKCLEKSIIDSGITNDNVNICDIINLIHCYAFIDEEKEKVLLSDGSDHVG